MSTLRLARRLPLMPSLLLVRNCYDVSPLGGLAPSSLWRHIYGDTAIEEIEATERPWSYVDPGKTTEILRKSYDSRPLRATRDSESLGVVSFVQTRTCRSLKITVLTLNTRGRHVLWEAF
jgi:hypothetical protein